MYIYLYLCNVVLVITTYFEHIIIARLYVIHSDHNFPMLAMSGISC